MNAEFAPPNEQLAWPVAESGEMDLPEIWIEPLPVVVQYLQENNSLVNAKRNLPDVELTKTGQNNAMQVDTHTSRH